MPGPVSLTDSDQPALWRASDAASIVSQRRYMLLTRAHLALLGGTGLLSAWSPRDQLTGRVVSGIIATLMFSALIFSTYLRAAHVDDAWFRTRALAENVKGAAWRFMMTPRPAARMEDEQQEKTFLDELARIQERVPGTRQDLVAHAVGGGEITPKMREIRDLALQDRLATYDTFRLNDQVEWYRRKAQMNAGAESRWSAMILVVEALAIVAAASRILDAHPYNPTGGVAAVAACFVAWSRTKRFSDLHSSYSVAHNDLKFLRARAGFVHDEAELQKFVDEVETAISREHRIWVERRTG